MPKPTLNEIADSHADLVWQEVYSRTQNMARANREARATWHDTWDEYYREREMDCVHLCDCVD